jgi:hypothetical protein
MGIDDGPADRQPHSHSAGLRGVESLENALDMLRIDARPGIANRDKDAFASVCSVLIIGSSRGPASTELIASTAFSTRFRMTCCN